MSDTEDSDIVTCDIGLCTSDEDDAEMYHYKYENKKGDKWSGFVCCEPLCMMKVFWNAERQRQRQHGITKITFKPLE